MSVNQVPLIIIVASREAAFFLTGISKEILWVFSIPPHNEGHNKHGYIVTTFWFK